VPVETYVPPAAAERSAAEIKPIPLADEAHDSIDVDRRDRLDPSAIKDNEAPPL
jgi:hypothetical protein